MDRAVQAGNLKQMDRAVQAGNLKQPARVQPLGVA
jgi:hypothetical protein